MRLVSASLKFAWVLFCGCLPSALLARPRVHRLPGAPRAPRSGVFPSAISAASIAFSRARPGLGCCLPRLSCQDPAFSAAGASDSRAAWLGPGLSASLCRWTVCCCLRRSPLSMLLAAWRILASGPDAASVQSRSSLAQLPLAVAAIPPGHSRISALRPIKALISFSSLLSAL